jgi:hypothetical protein
MQGSYAFWSVEHLYTQGDGTAQALAYVQYQAHEMCNEVRNNQAEKDPDPAADPEKGRKGGEIKYI